MGYQPVTFDEQDLKKIFKTDTPLGRFWRAAKRYLRSLVYLSVIFIIFYYLLNFSAFWNRWQYTYNQTPKVDTPALQIPTVEVPVVNYTPEIVIEKVGVKAPIVFGVEVNNIEKELSNGVVHYPNSAYPGEIGNFVLIGHSSDYPWSTGKYKNIFALLDKLTVGDKISVPYQSQIFTYEVTSTKIVKPTEVSVLKKTDTATLTLVTCYPVGSTRSRFIVMAKLTEGITTGIQQTDPLTTNLPTPR